MYYVLCMVHMYYMLHMYYVLCMLHMYYVCYICIMYAIYVLFMVQKNITFKKFNVLYEINKGGISQP